MSEKRLLKDISDIKRYKKSDNEQSYPFVPSITENSFTWMGEAPLIPAEKKWKYENMNTKVKYQNGRQSEVYKTRVFCGRDVFLPFNYAPLLILPVRYKYCHPVAMKGTYTSYGHSLFWHL